MLNIKRAEYTLRFLTEANFVEDPEISIYKSIFKRLKRILCINTQKECKTCQHNSKCLYSYVTAGDFLNIDMMPIIVKKPLISKKHVGEGKTIKLELVFLGDAALHADFIDFILKEFEVKGLFKESYKFVIARRYLYNISLNKSNSPIKNIDVLTPIDRTDNVFSYEKEKIERLNRLYHITDEPIELVEEPYKTNFIQFNFNRALHLGANKIKLNGYVGKLTFINPVELTPLLAIMKIIGAGRYYGIGGGSIAF